MALREKRMLGKVRCMLKVTDPDMPANPLTKHNTTQPIFNGMMESGELHFNGSLLYRKSKIVKDFKEKDLLNVDSGEKDLVLRYDHH